MTLELVIFDCDGVLVDTEPVTDRIIAASLTQHGLPMTPDQVSALFVGGTLAGVAQEAKQRGAALHHDWVDQTYAAIFQAFEAGVPVFDGVFALLDALDAAGIATAIASNGPMRKMEMSLGPSGLFQRFAGRIYSAHDFVPKPDPTLLHHAMQVAGCTPEETVFIDDSVTGATAGINAGVRTFGFTPAGDDGRRAAIGAEPVRSMAEIAGLLGL